MAIDLVVFDMAGTAVYDGDAVNTCLRAALSSAGVAVTRADVNGVMGMPKPQAIALLVEQQRGRGELPSIEEVDMIHQDFERRMIGHYRASAEVREADGASLVLQALRDRGIKLALDTGFNRRIADVILERLGWTDSTVDAVVTSDEVQHGRPDPAMIYRAMTLTGVLESARVAKVGDTPADLKQGISAGCALVVGVTSGSHTREELTGWGHTHLIDHLSELVPLVDRFDHQPAAGMAS